MVSQEKKLTCLECEEAVANSNNVLARHVRSVHGLEWSAYVVKHQHGGEWPTCECGCGEGLPWRKGGFGRFIDGHESRGPNNPMARPVEPDVGPGWHHNRFTGKEEHLTTDDQVAFLQHCYSAEEPITRDHGLRIAWEDASDRTHVYSPAFLRVGSRVIFDLDGFADLDADRRWAAIRTWCDQHGFTIILLRRDEAGFNVVGGYRKPA